MGITIKSTVHSCDMGCGGFARLRTHIANAISSEVGNHYVRLFAAPYFGREAFYKEYDAETRRLISVGAMLEEAAAFLYARDSDGKCDRAQVKILRPLIESLPDDEPYGYCARADCATAKDIKRIFSTKGVVTWE
ncbi:MAG: hypothetical protein ACYC6J_08670 [Coriobacteriia bacterium]